MDSRGLRGSGSGSGAKPNLTVGLCASIDIDAERCRPPTDSGDLCGSGSGATPNLTVGLCASIDIDAERCRPPTDSRDLCGSGSGSDDPNLTVGLVCNGAPSSALLLCLRAGRGATIDLLRELSAPCTTVL